MQIVDALVGLYAPHSCVGCAVDGAVLCQACLAGLEPAVVGCYRCKRPTGHGRTCSGCLPANLCRVRPAVRYTTAAKAAVWRLKFQRAQAVAATMASVMARSAPLPDPRLRQRIIVAPAPTATSRRRTRGYDQAMLLARAYAKLTGLPYASLLQRLGEQRQLGADRQQRRTQLRHAFQVGLAARRRLTGCHIILIDDVVTTGATLDAAAAVLLAAGARSVEAVTFARA